MFHREKYSIIKVPIDQLCIFTKADSQLSISTKLINNEPNTDLYAGIVRRADGLNCYVEDDNCTIVMLPPTVTNKSYDHVIFHRFQIVYSINYGKPEVAPVNGSKLIETYQMDSQETYYLKCYQAANRSKVVSLSNNDDYKSYHKMALPVHFNNSDGLKTFITERINSNKMITIKDLIEMICKSESANGIMFDENEIFIDHGDPKVKVYWITIKDIIIDVDWK